MAVLCPNPVLQYFNDDGSPLAGGLLFTYQAGTDTLAPTYTTAAGNVQNTNPIVLDARGQAIVWLSGDISYKIVLARPGDGDAITPPTSPIWTVDNVTASAIPSGLISMWHGSAATIPAGWFLCDGTNGTPDLRDRFIVGAGNTYLPGDTGGSASQTTTIGSHTLTILEIPAHAHGVTDPGHLHATTDPGHVHVVTDPGHTHGVTDGGHVHPVNDPMHFHGITDPGHTHQIETFFPSVLGGPNPLTTLVGAPGAFTDTSVTNIGINNAFTGLTVNLAPTGVLVNSGFTGLTVNNHVTNVAINTAVTSISLQDTGGGGGHTHTATNTTNLPPYYALCYIMKG